MEVIIPIGISGSGKTRLYKKRYSDLTLLSPDIIRKEITGSINDFSKQKDVYNEVWRRVDEYIKNNESFYYDDCNLEVWRRKKLINKLKDTDAEITYIVFPANVDVSEERIKTDLENNIDRGEVMHQSLIFQLDMYNYTMCIGFGGENIQNIIYLKPGELD